VNDRDSYRLYKGCGTSAPSLNDDIYHPETVINLVCHCLEMEGDLEGALGMYNALRNDMPRNNAANLHILRLTGLQ